MKTTQNKQTATQTLVLGGILTALVIILQMMGTFVRFGPFQIALVLIPIVVGAATCGVGIGAWLGFVFGLVVLINGDAAAFLAINIPGTIITVLLKGTACGLAAALVYKLFEKTNIYLAVIAAAIVCPVVNTGIFLLGSAVFFIDTIAEWGAAEGYENTASYMFLGLAGGNFLVELVVNIVLSPVIVRILNIRKKAHN